jgi:hypothetical protein
MVVSFHTPDELYSNHAAEFIKTLQALNVRYDVEAVPSRDQWEENCAIKPEFILSKLEEHPESNIVWIDVDARVRQYPELFQHLDGDLGLHWKDGKELLSGTMFFRNNERVREFVQKWIEVQEAAPQMWDQKTLEAALKANQARLNLDVVDLPPQYVQIFDSMRKWGAPVIEHLQASRAVRRERNKLLSKHKGMKPTPADPADRRIGVGNPMFESRFANAKSATLLKNQLKGKPCIIYGNSSSLNAIPLEKLLEFPAITCNRGLRLFKPDYYIVVDRDPYRQDLDLITDFKGVRVLSSTIYNERTLCHRVPVQPIPSFDFYYFRPYTSSPPANGYAGRSHIPVVQDDWERGILSAGNIAFPMFQLAVMLGANPIGIAGVDLEWRNHRDSHFFGNGSAAGCFRFGTRRVLKFFNQAAVWMRERKIACYNLSPEGVLDCFPRLPAMEFYRRFGQHADGALLHSRQLVVPELRATLGGRRGSPCRGHQPHPPDRRGAVAFGVRRSGAQIRGGKVVHSIRDEIAAVRSALLRRPKVGPVAMR